jgi:hypothetical protein
MKLIDFVHHYLDAGLSVIPIWPDRRKNPHLSSVKEYNQRLPTKAEWSGWARRWPDTNIGLITGYFRRLVGLDFDDELTFDVWRKGLLDESLLNTWTVKTARGYHVWYSLRYKNNTIPCDTGVSRIFVKGDLEVLLRARGGYCIVPPSVHYTGKRYHTITNKKPLSVYLDDVLFGWSEKQVQEHHSIQRAYIPTHYTVKIEDLIKPVVDNPNFRGALQAFCPFHDDKTPSAWINVEEQRFGCNACWPGLWWDTVNVYAMLKNITNGEAYKLLRVAP